MAAKWIAFHLTDRCNLNCQHCLRDPDQYAKDLPVEVFIKVLDEVKHAYGTTHVALTGGEPTLHPEFPALVDNIVAREMTWHMVTNGSRFGRVLQWFDERPSREQAATAMDFSLDGSNEKTHDGIRGAGSYREVMAAIVACRAREIPFVLQMVVNAKNVDEIEEFALNASQLGPAKISISWLQPTGTLHDRTLYLPPSTWRQVRDRIARLQEILNVPVGMPEGHHQPQAFHVCDPFRSDTLHVDVQGRLNLCCQHSGIPSDGERSDIAGDLKEVSLTVAHKRLLEIIHETQAARLDAIDEGLSDWDYFPCNWCLKRFGKPHWQDENTGGPAATRARWRGAWDGGENPHRVLPVLPKK